MFIFMYTESLHLEKKGSGSTIKRDQIKENILHGFKIKQINYNQSGPNINVVFVAMQSKVDVISKSWAKQRLFSTFGWNYRDCCWHSGQLFPCINAIMHTDTPVIKQPRRDIYWWSNSECIKHKQKQLSEPSPAHSHGKSQHMQQARHGIWEAWSESKPTFCFLGRSQGLCYLPSNQDDSSAVLWMLLLAVGKVLHITQKSGRNKVSDSWWL